MLKMNKHSIIQNILIILSFLLISILTVIVLFHTHTLYGAGDMQFHVRRIIELKESIMHGSFLPTFGINQFHGSAVMTLYPYINLYPAVLLLLITKSVIKTIYLFLSFNTFLSLFISFYSGYLWNHSKYISYVFSIIYSLSAPFITYYYGNMDLGVSSVLAYMPLIIFGFMFLFKSNNVKWIMLPFGMILVVYSHVLSIFILLGLVLLWAIVNIKMVTKIVVRNIIKSIALVILFTSVIWIPAFDLILFNKNNIRPLNTPQLYGYKISFLLKSSLLNYPNFCLGAFSILSIIASSILYKYFNRWNKQMFWISIFVIFIGSDLFPWTILAKLSLFKLLNVFQFTYRFFIIPQIFLSYLLAVAIFKLLQLLNWQKYKYIILIIMTIFPVISQICLQDNIITTNSNNKTFNYRYIKNNRKTIKEEHAIIKNNQLNNTHIKEHVIDYKINYHYGYMSPKFNITNNDQIKNFCKADIKGLASLDYYPMDSVINLNYVNNNDAFKNKSLVKLYQVGYDRFSLTSNKSIKNIHLPLLIYKHENLKLYINNHIHKYNISNNGLIVTNLNKGYNNIYIKNNSNNNLIIEKIILFLLGVLFCLFCICHDMRHIRRKKG